MKPRSNGNIMNGQDIMMNLLGDSSESDPELLKLPPLKGKKTKRKKHYSSSDGYSLCNIWTLFKVFLVVLLVCTVSVLGFITVWLSGQVKDLKDRLEDVQSKNLNSVSNVQDLVSQIQDINKTINKIKTGEHGLDQMWISMTTMSKQIAALNESTRTIQDSINLKTATNFKQLTSQIPVISSSVADLGVGVKSLKSTVQELTDFKKKMEEHLHDILNPTSKNGGKESMDSKLPEGGSALNPDFVNDISNKFETLTESITQANSSLWSRVASIQLEIDQHQAKFMTLDNSTALMQKKLDELMKNYQPSAGTSSGDNDRDVNNEQIKAVVQQMIQGMGLAYNGTKDSEILNSLQQNVDNITMIMTRLKDDFSQWKQESQDTSTTDDGISSVSFLQKVEALNKTVQHISTDFETLMQKVIRQQNQLVNVSHTVSTIQQFVSALEKEHTEIKTGIEGNSGVLPNIATPAPPSSTGATKAIPDNSGTISNKNEPPTASTAGRLTVVLPVDKLVLDGQNSTDDKEIVKYAWEQIRGPNKVTITDADQPVATATGDFKPGTYIFAIQVFDEEGTSSEMKLYYVIEGQPVTAPNPELHAFVNLSLIKNYEDLKIGVRRWDKDGDGLVTPDNFVGFMPDPPKASELEPFDFNHDGKYNVDELAVALGFKPLKKDKGETDEKSIDKN